jgi:Tfp pilus assembly protein PilX
MMKCAAGHEKNKKGMALVMALIVIVISAGLVAGVMYYALSGSETSGLQRKYQSSKEASLGAIDVLVKEIIPRAVQADTATTGEGLSNVIGTFQSIPGIVNAVSPSASNLCFRDKLTKARSLWTNCTTETDKIRIDPTQNPDITFKLLSVSGTTKSYEVRLKIVDTSLGNTNMSGIMLEGLGVVESGSGTITAKHTPYLYTIATEGKLENSTTERANIEVLYAY